MQIFSRAKSRIRQGPSLEDCRLIDINALVAYMEFCGEYVAWNIPARLSTISAPEILARVFSALKFHHRKISATAPFGHADVPADWRFNTGTFGHGEFSAWGIFSTRNIQHHGHFSTRYFGTCIFWHMDISAPCKVIWMFWHRHFGTCATVPKFPHAEISPCRNVPVPKYPRAVNSSPQKIQMSKCSSVKRQSDGTSALIWWSYVLKICGTSQRCPWIYDHPRMFFFCSGLEIPKPLLTCYWTAAVSAPPFELASI